jgi:hypothetical protein
VLSPEEYGREYRIVSGTCSILHFAAATIPSTCRLSQLVATRRRRFGKTFNPKVVASIPTRHVVNACNRPNSGVCRQIGLGVI